MDVCKCGARTVSYMVKAGKKIECTGCGREAILTYYVDKPNRVV